MNGAIQRAKIRFRNPVARSKVRSQPRLTDGDWNCRKSWTAHFPTWWLCWWSPKRNTISLRDWLKPAAAWLYKQSAYWSIFIKKEKSFVKYSL